MTDLVPNVSTMKAISLWQPWATLIALGLKKHETRHWPTSYRGPIAIHAAKTLDLAGAPDELLLSALGYGWLNKLPLGAIVAVAELRAVHSATKVAHAVTRADRMAGNFADGRFAWELAKVRPLAAPIRMAGRQGLFQWEAPDDLEARLGPVVDHETACRAVGWL